MQIQIAEIPIRNVLHFLGWHGTPLNTKWLDEIQKLTEDVKDKLRPQAIIHPFFLEADGRLSGTIFSPKGKDVQKLLTGCKEVLLLAATLGTDSERMLLQARTPQQELLLDAVLSAAIEAVCDQLENEFRTRMNGLYVTDRFSPGYGDMPMEQSREICAVLAADRTIGLSITANGIMIPRKSVTAILGISNTPVIRRPNGCPNCRADCPIREK